MSQTMNTNAVANGISSTNISSTNGDKIAMQKFYEPSYDISKQNDVMAQIQAQNVLSSVHQQFHHNQGKYIDLLTKVVEYQAVMVERYQNSSTLPKVMQNIEQILHILHNNQSHYNSNHEGYLQNQLALIQGEEFLTNTSNTLNDSSLNQVPNYPIFQTEAEAQISPAPNLPASNKPSNGYMEVAANYPIDEAEIAPPSSKQQEVHKSVDKSTSQSSTSQSSTSQSSTSQSSNGKAASELTFTSPQVISPLKAVVITQETTSTNSTPSSVVNSTYGSSVNSTPKVEPISTPPQVSPILENSNHPVENNSTNVVSTPPAPVVNNSTSVVSTPPAPVVDASATSSVDVTKFSTRLLEVISDKTGYPIDMLDMDMDLEADLGIDSIKQVQIFAAMQEEFPQVELDAEALADLRTLAKVVDYVKEYLESNQQPQTAIERQVVKKNS